MGCKETVSVKVEEDLAERIDKHQERQDFEYRSEAVQDLLQTGYREKHSPLLYRAKQQSKDIAFYLPLVAATVAIVGQVTAVLPRGSGITVAAVLLVMSVTPLATVETIRRARSVLQSREVIA